LLPNWKQLMFFKKDKIRFFCELDEVKERYPIISAQKIKFDWFKTSAKNFKHMADTKGAYEQISGVVKCPGVSPIMKKGYIVQSWFDLTIRFHDDGFEYFIPEGILSYLKEKGFKKTLVNGFNNAEPAHATPIPESQFQGLLKITTPWSVSIPKGWELLLQPIPYPDDINFSAVHGILEHGDFYHLNAIIRCNQYHREFTIPAGTPLFQIIPIKTTKSNVVFERYTNEIKKKEDRQQFDAHHQFIIKK